MNKLSGNIIAAVKEIKTAIVKAQACVTANANAELLMLYCGIGQYVSHKTKTEKWGTGVIDAISRQLQEEMPGLRGFSSQNMRKMCQFAEIWGGPSVMPLVTKEICSPVASETENASLSSCSPVARKLRVLDNDRIFPASMEVAPYSPIALENVRTVPAAMPGLAAGQTTFQKIFQSLIPRVLPA